MSTPSEQSSCSLPCADEVTPLLQRLLSSAGDVDTIGGMPVEAFLSDLFQQLDNSIHCYSTEVRHPNVDDLFQMYRLSLKCLQRTSHSFSEKLKYQASFVDLLIDCEKLDEAEREGLLVLGSVFPFKPSGAQEEANGEAECYKPMSNDSKLAHGVVKVTIFLLENLCRRESQDANEYSIILAIVQRIDKWLSVMKADKREGSQKVLAFSLGETLMVLLKKFNPSKTELLKEFGTITFKIHVFPNGRLAEEIEVLVATWVETICQSNLIPIAHVVGSVYQFFPPDLNKDHMMKILEKELSEFMENEHLSPDLSIVMQQKIAAILLERIYIGDSYRVQKAILLIREGRLKRASPGMSGLKGCMQSLLDAIDLLGDELRLSSQKIIDWFVSHHLAVAQCLLAMCYQELYEDSRDDSQIISRISNAVGIWSKITEDKPLDKAALDLEIKKALPLIISMADLLSMKGVMEYHFQIIKLTVMRDGDLSNKLAFLSAGKRLSHGLCTSPIDNNLLHELSHHYGTELLSLDFWLYCTKHEDPSIYLNFIVSYWSEITGDHHKESFLVSAALNSIEEDANTLLKNAPKFSSQAFMAANLFYGFSEKLVENGRLHQALSLAMKAFTVRRKFMRKKFNYSDDVTVTEERFISERIPFYFEISTLSAISLWPRSPYIEPFDKPFITLWGIIISYLESCLQIGIINELMGNVREATLYLRMGHNLSVRLGLPVFRISFGVLLGKIYSKAKKFDLAETEFLKCSESLLEYSVPTFCLDCKSVLRISYEWEYNIFIQDRSFLVLGELGNNLFIDPLEIYVENKDYNHDQQQMTMPSLIELKWKYKKKKLTLESIMNLEKYANSMDAHDQFQRIVKGFSIIFDRDISGKCVNLSNFCALIGQNAPHNSFALEEADLLYKISVLYLEKSFPEPMSNCFGSNIDIATIVSWLLKSFVLSRHTFGLFKKISKLLAILFLLFGEEFSPPSHGSLSLSHWIAYFNEVGIGHHIYGKWKYISELKVSQGFSYDVGDSEPISYIPERVEDFTKFVEDFFSHIPPITMICINLFGNEDGKLVKDLVRPESFSNNWILITRFSPNRNPLNILLPIENLLEDPEKYKKGEDLVGKLIDRKWICPWQSPIDQVIPEYRLWRYHLFYSNFHYTDKNDANTTKWKARRVELNDLLKELLSEAERSWFGPWRCMFLGDPLTDTNPSDSQFTNLLGKLQQLDAKMLDYVEHFRIIFNGNLTSDEKKECLKQVFLYRGKQGQSRCSSSSYMRVEDEALLKLLFAEIAEVETPKIKRNPMILVLDDDMQMLPFESLPELKPQEIYRMPCVGSIQRLLKVGIGSHSSPHYPCKNPLESYYLVNPTNDNNLKGWQTNLVDFFKSHGIKEGKVGENLSSKDFAKVLGGKELFLYFGHGRGLKYFKEEMVAAVEKCAAAFLMGCCTASLIVRGVYAPYGISLSYILAESPCVIANLWEVNTKEVTHFSKQVINAWMKEARDNPLEYSSSSSSEESTLRKISESVSLASFIPCARNVTDLSYVSGASHICQGLPTMIPKKICL